MREWLTVAEIVALGSPALPASEKGLALVIDREGWRDDSRRARERAGRGGGWEYHVSRLPAETQARWLAQQQAAQPDPAQMRAQAEWDRYARLPQRSKDEALRRLSVIERIELLAQAMPLRAAVPLAAREAGVSASTVWTWHRSATGVAREHRLAALAPRHAGRTATAECDDRAWQFLVTDYLRRDEPAFDACYRRLVEEAAPAQGWGPIPSKKTLRRRLEREFPRAARVLARQGADAAKRTYPAQQRDRSVFHAMQAVNADGHTLDVFVRMADGKVERPTLLAIQDVYSGMIVGWRLDRSENWHAVRLALADMAGSYGVPEVAYMDNGRAFASKWISGGSKTRYRFKVRAEEPEGVLTRLGVQIRWVTPYHGQAKPVERAFRDLAENIARHPACSGAYTGPSPEKKPDNYGQRAIPVEEFERHVAEQIARHNRREGRATATARGRSFEATFRESYEKSLVRRASPEQLRELLLAAEGVTCRRPDGSIHLADNRYWHAALGDLVGRRVTVRFDPAALFEPVAVYLPDGRYLCEAACLERTGFDDIESARAHARKRNDYLRALRELRDREIALSVDDLAGMLPPPEQAPPPRPAAVRLVAAGGRRAPAAEAEPAEEQVWAGADAFGRAVRAIEDADVLPFRRSRGEDS